MSVELVMLSNHLILCCPLVLLPSIFPSIRVFSNETALHIRWPKYLLTKFMSMGMTHRKRSVDAVGDGGNLCWRNGIQSTRKRLAFERGRGHSQKGKGVYRSSYYVDWWIWILENEIAFLDVYLFFRHHCWTTFNCIIIGCFFPLRKNAKFNFFELFNVW